MDLRIFAMKKQLLLLILPLFTSMSYGAGAIEETITYGCAGCDQSLWEALNRAQMDLAASAAEAQRGLAAQREAEARAAAQEANRRRQAQECGQKKASISGSLSGCNAAASSVRSRTYNSCPVETEVSTGIGVGLGDVIIKTSPRKTCIENADVAFNAAIDACEATASGAAAALPAYCY
jgi:hypothetical protein